MAWCSRAPADADLLIVILLLSTEPEQEAPSPAYACYHQQHTGMSTGHTGGVGAVSGGTGILWAAGVGCMCQAHTWEAVG